MLFFLEKTGQEENSGEEKLTPFFNVSRKLLAYYPFQSATPEFPSPLICCPNHKKSMWVDPKPKYSSSNCFLRKYPRLWAGRIVFRAEFPPEIERSAFVVPCNLCCCCGGSLSVYITTSWPHKRPGSFSFSRSAPRARAVNKNANGNKRRRFWTRVNLHTVGLQCRQGNKGAGGPRAHLSGMSPQPARKRATFNAPHPAANTM
jgi:hypothetical protein